MTTDPLRHAAEQLAEAYASGQDTEPFMQALLDELTTLHFQEKQMLKKYIAIDIALPGIGSGIDKGQLLLDINEDADLISKLLGATVIKQEYTAGYHSREYILAYNSLTMSQVTVDLSEIKTEQKFKEEQDAARRSIPIPTTAPAYIEPLKSVAVEEVERPLAGPEA